ncbi:hydroxyacid dehydrogenase [Mesorhizobium sp.]|uniref:hydroxyacid dehydrogenase n=1 Tax=Mesorhizobium sp. TaxID=1871066 RepID=UPI001225AEB6|nr:hydroxyacid dehydrogenase [Mesorhizobium sp.]TIS56364.1 MAG: hydroxyacid dehydrogenase [Mesorhizobium sp.]TIS90970.1 MAG: hydroxyacid dehydrogenase [Mesorhizobium sp.]
MRQPAIAFAMQAVRTKHVVTPEIIERLAAAGRILSSEPVEDFADPRAKRLLAETEILITSWGCPLIGSDVLASAPQLKLVAHAAGTVKGLLDSAVFEAGIAVTHAAQANAVPVAEFTLAAIIFAGKRVFRFHELYAVDRNRHRVNPMQAEAIGNYGRTIGIVGSSRIGRRVIELLKPFDYSILLYDPMVDAEEAARHGTEKVELNALMSRADIVSLHAPSLPATRHMIGEAELALMRDGATLINTARGALVDEAALLTTLKTGRIDAIIDVTDPEVPNVNSPFYALPNVFLTPHIAGAVGLERARLGNMAADEVLRYIAGEPLLHEIRRQDLEHIA